MASGTPLTDAHRAPWVAAIKQRLQDNANHVTHTVLAFSGLKKKHREQLRLAGLKTLFLYLDGDKKIIHDRIKNRKGHFMPAALLDSQFASMEDPLNEPDVHLIDVLPGFTRVSEQARAIIDQYFQH